MKLIFSPITLGAQKFNSIVVGTPLSFLLPVSSFLLLLFFFSFIILHEFSFLIVRLSIHKGIIWSTITQISFFLCFHFFISLFLDEAMTNRQSFYKNLSQDDWRLINKTLHTFDITYSWFWSTSTLIINKVYFFRWHNFFPL